MPITISETAFANFEALQHVVQDKSSEVMQIGRGRMSGTITHLSFGPNFGISTGSFSKSMRACGPLSDTRWCLGLLLETDGPASGHGAKFGVGDLAIAAPGAERYVRFQDSTKYIATLIDPQELQTFLTSQPGAQEELDRQWVSVVPVDPATAAINVARLQPLLDALTEHGPTIPNETAEFYERNILELLTAPIRDASRYQGREPTSAIKLVAEVDRFLVDAGTRPIHISELCERFNVGRRRLHRAFHDVLGMPPISFLRQKRLGDVHSVLLQGGPDLMIRDVAVAHGFIELGRFAQEYRRLFGELPSTTMRRTRAMQAN